LVEIFRDNSSGNKVIDNMIRCTQVDFVTSIRREMLAPKGTKRRFLVQSNNNLP
ncbi:1713_t:CDS:2, partial [Rhizophagus irregularis]